MIYIHGNEIVFDIPVERASELAAEIACHFAARLAESLDEDNGQEKIAPAPIVAEVVKKYEGKERDFACYTLGRMGGIHTTVEDLEAGKEVMSPFKILVTLYKENNFQSPEELIKRCEKAMKKVARDYRAEEILSQIKTK